jgi:uncharacterized protein
MAKFVLELAFDRDNNKRLQLRPRHRDHLQSLLAQGKLVMAGPWKDDAGALLIFDVADEKEMNDILARDPYGYNVADAVSVVSLREWAPILPA